MTTRQLAVHIDQDQVGVLFEHAGFWSFQYLQSWVESGYALAPGLPLQTAEILDSGSLRPVQWFFDNLLPEEAAWVLLSRVAPGQSIQMDAWDMLSAFGAESAGALSLLPPGDTLSEGGLKSLPNDEIERRIQAMPRQALATHAPKKMSIAGAQQKLLVVKDQKGALYEPVGATASTHILKPNVSSEHYPCSAVNEWFCAALAKRVGLPVPEVELRYVPSPIYLIQRFDRDESVRGVRRLHALDAAQLLSLSAGAKYARSGVAALTEISARTRTPLTARTALFRWTLFNILIGNSDAHLKNISLFAGKAGYALAPHYDLVSTAAWSTPSLLSRHEARWPRIPMSFPIDSAVTYAELTNAHLITFAQQLGMAGRTAERESRRMIEAILPAARALLAEFEARQDVPHLQRASQLHMLRTILHMCIGEMCEKLG